MGPRSKLNVGIPSPSISPRFLTISDRSSLDKTCLPSSRKTKLIDSQISAPDLERNSKEHAKFLNGFSKDPSHDGRESSHGQEFCALLDIFKVLRHSYSYQKYLFEKVI